MPAWLLAALVLPADGFVLQGVNATKVGLASLPGTAQRWRAPSASSDLAGLGGGLAWVLDDKFCDEIMPHFPEKSVVSGISWLNVADFVTCDDLKAAILRGFSTWTENHRRVSFDDISKTASCAMHSPSVSDACPWELYISTDDGKAYPALAAYVFTHKDSVVNTNWFTNNVEGTNGVVAQGVDAHYRSVMRFQTHLCWYLDATFCFHFQKWSDLGVDVPTLVRGITFLIFGLACIRLLVIFFWLSVAVFCLPGGHDEGPTLVHKQRNLSAKCSAVLDYVSSLSPLGNVLVIFFIIFPLVFYERIYLPCHECYDFEAAAAHETGHVLGFGHPDQRYNENIVAKDGCAIDASTCSDAFQCAKLREYAGQRESRARRRVRRCRHAPLPACAAPHRACALSRRAVTRRRTPRSCTRSRSATRAPAWPSRTCRGCTSSTRSATASRPGRSLARRRSSSRAGCGSARSCSCPSSSRSSSSCCRSPCCDGASGASSSGSSTRRAPRG